jgi:hypothetical protein
MGSPDLLHSQASKQAAHSLDMLNEHLELAASTLNIDISSMCIVLEPNQFPAEVFSDEESGPEDVEDKAARTVFASYGARHQLLLGSYILHCPKPYLSTSVSASHSDDQNTLITYIYQMKKLTAFVWSLYKLAHGKQSMSQRRITGPDSSNIPIGLHLEEWVIDPKWASTEDCINLVKLPNTIMNADQFEVIIDYAMKSWTDDQVLGIGTLSQVNEKQVAAIISPFSTFPTLPDISNLLCPCCHSQNSTRLHSAW